MLHCASGAVRKTKKINTKIGKEEMKLSLFTCIFSICIENPKESTDILLQLINGNNVIIKKLYTCETQTETETKRMPFKNG